MSPRRTGEFELIARLKAVLDQSQRNAIRRTGLLLGIGDDCAVARRPAGYDLLTTDTMVDGVHFRSGRADWQDIGWKAMAVNQSDIASMGGTPLYALVTLGLPFEASPADMEELYRGISDACAAHGGVVAGGDIVRSPVMFITVSLTGEASRRASGSAVVMRRDAARPGHLIGVTGPLGSSAGGLRAISEHVNTGDAVVLKRTHTRPEPRVKEGRALIAAGVRAAMDVSDGLVADLGKLSKASGVGAGVSLAKLPVAPELKAMFPEDWQEMALSGGEDYELLFTAPASVMGRALRSVGHRACVIGEVRSSGTSGSIVEVTDEHGKPVEVRRAGWDHLAG